MNRAPAAIAPASVADERESTGTDISLMQTEQLPLIQSSATEVPEISRGAWKVIILLLIGEVLFLASVGAYVFSGLHRFQDCL